jgi:hypothetical protein
MMCLAGLLEGVPELCVVHSGVGLLSSTTPLTAAVLAVFVQVLRMRYQQC